MNYRKHMFLIVGGAIELVLLIIVVVLLLRFQGGYLKVSRDLKDSIGRLERLNQRDPFPSKENVEIVQQNEKVFGGLLTRLQTDLRANQAEPEQIEPAQFVPLLERTARKLNARAAEAGTKLPAKFVYGFELYALGQPPAIDQIPRLVTQIKQVEAVCNLLFDARIAEITGMKRQQFEGGATSGPAPADGGGRGGGRGGSEQPASSSGPINTTVPEAPASDLYQAERVEVSFLARENNYWDVVNALGRAKPLMVLADIRLENPPSQALLDVPAATERGGAEDAAASVHPVYRSHEDRVVAGREPVKVTLVIDAYRFSGAPAGEAAK